MKQIDMTGKAIKGRYARRKSTAYDKLIMCDDCNKISNNKTGNR